MKTTTWTQEKDTFYMQIILGFSCGVFAGITIVAIWGPQIVEALLK